MTAAKKAAAAPATARPTYHHDEELPPEVWEALTAPFTSDEIEKLPKQMRRDDQEKSGCKPGTNASADGFYCGGYHARSMHLDYAGHATITTRLNNILGPTGWLFEPMAYDSDGLPIITGGGNGQFWCKLTIGGATKFEVAANYTSVQEALGDGLRRCAMRFGVGTYLWSKSETAQAIKADPDAFAPPPPPAEWTGPATGELLARIDAHATALGLTYAGITAKWRLEHGNLDIDALDSIEPWVIAPLEAAIADHLAKNPPPEQPSAPERAAEPAEAPEVTPAAESAGEAPQEPGE